MLKPGGRLVLQVPCNYRDPALGPARTTLDTSRVSTPNFCRNLFGSTEFDQKDSMKYYASVVALGVIAFALAGCAKKPATATMAQQTPSGVRIVTNADGTVSMFQNVIKRNTNIGTAPQNPSGTQRFTNADGTVTVLRNRIKRATNSAPATNGPSQ